MVNGEWCTCGQVCCAVERVYVADAIFDAFEAEVVQQAKSYVAGNGLDAKSMIGPMVGTATITAASHWPQSHAIMCHPRDSTCQFVPSRAITCHHVREPRQRAGERHAKADCARTRPGCREGWSQVSCWWQSSSGI